MKRAVKLPQYSDTKDFTPPAGVDLVKLDKTTNLLADATCPDDYNAAFLDGTAPTDTCGHPNDQRNFSRSSSGWATRAAISCARQSARNPNARSSFPESSAGPRT